MDRLGLGVIVHCFNATTPAFVINIWVGSALILWISSFDNDCRHSRVILCSWLAVVKNTYLLPTPSKLWKELSPGHIMSLQVKLWYSNHFCHPVEGCQKDEGCEILHALYWRGSTDSTDSTDGNGKCDNRAKFAWVGRSSGEEAQDRLTDQRKLGVLQFCVRENLLLT